MNLSSSTSPQPSVEAARDINGSFLYLTNRDARTVAVLAAVCLILMLSNWLAVASSERIPGATVPQLEQAGLQIEINKASLAEFRLLEGIGPALAQRIVDDRDERGPYRSVDDLQRVKGIGPKLVQKNRQWLKRDDVVR